MLPLSSSSSPFISATDANLLPFQISELPTRRRHMQTFREPPAALEEPTGQGAKGVRAKAAPPPPPTSSGAKSFLRTCRPSRPIYRFHPSLIIVAHHQLSASLPLVGCERPLAAGCHLQPAATEFIRAGIRARLRKPSERQHITNVLTGAVHKESPFSFLSHPSPSPPLGSDLRDWRCGTLLPRHQTTGFLVARSLHHRRPPPPHSSPSGGSVCLDSRASGSQIESPESETLSGFVVV